MSTAAKFAALDVFPQCLRSSATAGTFYQWTRNLTLAQVMAFYWNLETFTLTTSASVSGTYAGKTYSGTANGTFTLSPLGVTGDWTADTFDQGSGPGTLGWTRAASGTTLSAGDSSTAPRARVCIQGTLDVAPLAISLNDSRGSQYFSGSVYFVIATDSVNAGKYAIGSALFLYFPLTGSDSSVGTFLIYYISTSSGGGSYPIANGTFTVGGFSFPYYSSTDLPSATTSGGTLTATSSDYTY